MNVMDENQGWVIARKMILGLDGGCLYNLYQKSLFLVSSRENRNFSTNQRKIKYRSKVKSLS